jgi:ketosteroid isomerase-like protein
VQKQNKFYKNTFMKKILLILLVLFTLLSCNSKVENNINAEAFVKKYFDYFNAHDWQGLANNYTDTADFKDPSLGKEIVKQTRLQTATKYAELAAIFPNIHDEVKHIYSSNKNEVIVEFISTGTSAEGTFFTLPICTIFTIENGKITKDFTYFDNSSNAEKK